jgi:hypothetical protein
MSASSRCHSLFPNMKDKGQYFSKFPLLTIRRLSKPGVIQNEKLVNPSLSGGASRRAVAGVRDVCDFPDASRALENYYKCAHRLNQSARTSRHGAPVGANVVPNVPVSYCFRVFEGETRNSHGRPGQ